MHAMAMLAVRGLAGGAQRMTEIVAPGFSRGNSISVNRKIFASAKTKAEPYPNCREERERLMGVRLSAPRIHSQIGLLPNLLLGLI